jgi:hypothetical protein
MKGLMFNTVETIIIKDKNFETEVLRVGGSFMNKKITEIVVSDNFFSLKLESEYPDSHLVQVSNVAFIYEVIMTKR